MNPVRGRLHALRNTLDRVYGENGARCARTRKGWSTETIQLLRAKRSIPHPHPCPVPAYVINISATVSLSHPYRNPAVMSYPLGAITILTVDAGCLIR
jgi:hypothetical protein